MTLPKIIIPVVLIYAVCGLEAMHLDFSYYGCIVRVYKDAAFRSFNLTSKNSTYSEHGTVTTCYQTCIDHRKRDRSFFQFNTTFGGEKSCFCLELGRSPERHPGASYGEVACPGR